MRILIVSYVCLMYVSVFHNAYTYTVVYVFQLIYLAEGLVCENQVACLWRRFDYNHKATVWQNGHIAWAITFR